MNSVNAEHPPTYIGIKDIPVTLRAPGTIFVDIKDADTMRLIIALDMVQCPEPAEIFESYVVPGIVDTQYDDWRGSLATIEYALQNFNILSDQCSAELSQAKIVPVPGPTGKILRKRPGDIVEPNSSVAALFFPDENRVADERFCRRYYDQLLHLGMVCSIDDEVVLERIEEYGNSEHSVEDIAERVQKLIADCTAPPPLPDRLRQLRWVPACSLDSETFLCRPEECRGPKDEKLVRYIMPVVGFPINKAWSSCFGWDRPLPQPEILRELEEAVEADDIEALEYLIKKKHITVEDFPEVLNTIEWIPSTSGIYCSPANIFLDDFTNLAPHFGTLNNRFKWYGHTFFSKIGVQTAPSFQQVRKFPPTRDLDDIFTGI